VTPSATPVTPSATPVTPSATPVTPSATPVTPSATGTKTPSRTRTPTGTCGHSGESCLGVCGNGIVECGEECDDGNTENGDGCSSDCRIEENFSLGQQFCTLTQGAWGAPNNGIANGPNGFLTLHPDILPVTIGGPDQSTTLHTVAALTAYLPKGGPPQRRLLPEARDFYTAEDVADNDDGAGVLAGQTVSLSLAVALCGDLNPDGDRLGDLILPTVSFCTQGLTAGNDGILGTSDDELDPNSQLAGPFLLPSSVPVTNNTVKVLLAMSNQYLRGAVQAVAPSDLNQAIDTINQAFDGCRRVVPCAP